jgi:F0F1-type ATP synthase membrane subunit b/b'
VDVLVLIDKLDELVQNAKGVPLSQDQVRVDREEIWEIIDQMRSTIPEEIKQARWIVKERQEMLAEAKREAERLIAEAREQAAREASQQEVVKLAERQAEEVLADRSIRHGAEDYADGILENLHHNLGKIMDALERGRAQLASKSDDREAGATVDHEEPQLQ